MKTVLSLSAALLLVGSTTAQSQCFADYQCSFAGEFSGQLYKWDLHKLCRPPGKEYFIVDSYNHTTSFNICGNTSSLCMPPYPLYESQGVVVMSWGAAPTPCENTCTDWSTGTKGQCCTGACAVLATQYSQFSVLDASNPKTGGVQIVHAGMPPDVDDPYNCPVDPASGLPRQRKLIINLRCDPILLPHYLEIIGITEPEVCRYVIEASSLDACGELVPAAAKQSSSSVDMD